MLNERSVHRRSVKQNARSTLQSRLACFLLIPVVLCSRGHGMRHDKNLRVLGKSAEQFALNVCLLQAT